MQYLNIESIDLCNVLIKLLSMGYIYRRIFICQIFDKHTYHDFKHMAMHFSNLKNLTIIQILGVDPIIM